MVELFGLNKIADRVGKHLIRHYSFDSPSGAKAFSNGISIIANKMNHHPNVKRDGNKVKVETWTHDKNKVTNKDHELIKQISRLMK